MGLYQMFLSIYIFLITLCSSGISLAITRIVAEDLAHDNIKGIQYATKKCMLISFSLGIFFIIMMFIFSKYISSTFLHDKISYKVLNLMTISLPFIGMSSVINGYFLAVRRIIKSASTQIFEQLIIPSRLTKSGLEFETSLAKYGIITTMVLPILLFPNFLIYSFSSLLMSEISRYFAKKDYFRIKK